MALVVPFLFLILFGIILFGMLLSFRQNLAQAAAEGARAGAVAVAGQSQADAQAAVNRAADAFSQSCNNGALTCTIPAPTLCPFPAAGPTCITVRLELETDQVLPSIPFLDVILPDSINAQSIAEVSR